MLSGLGISTVQAPLSAAEEDTLDEFFVSLSMSLGEYQAMPQEKREAMAAMYKTWHLTKLMLTRTAVKQ